VSGLPPIVYEDDDLVAFDKPSGMLSAPDRWDKSRENLMGLVHSRLGGHVANLHRLDAVTSGVLLCAKNREMLVALSGLWEGRGVRKRYLALVQGRAAAPDAREHPHLPADSPEGAWVVDLPIAEDLRQPGRMRVSHSSGKLSETVVWVEESFPAHTLLACEPLTGRTHQIRVHLSAIGLPILADPFYGGAPPLFLSTLKRRYKGKPGEPERPLIGRCALHAQSLEFSHPRTGERVRIEAPLANDFEVALKYLRKLGK
jgi:RluA family pseudouridine synthase